MSYWKIGWTCIIIFIICYSSAKLIAPHTVSNYERVTTKVTQEVPKVAQETSNSAKLIKIMGFIIIPIGLCLAIVTVLHGISKTTPEIRKLIIKKISFIIVIIELCLASIVFILLHVILISSIYQYILLYV